MFSTTLDVVIFSSFPFYVLKLPVTITIDGLWCSGLYGLEKSLLPPREKRKEGRGGGEGEKRERRERRERERKNWRKRTKKITDIKAKRHTYSFLKANLHLYAKRFSEKSTSRKVVLYIFRYGFMLVYSLGYYLG